MILAFAIAASFIAGVSVGIVGMLWLVGRLMLPSC